MNRTICSFKYVVSWIFCAVVLGLSPYSFGQQNSPSLIPVNVSNFTIPFEVSESVTAVQYVELLVSKDRGRRWHAVARQPIESGKFAFRADSNGEHWFAFRTVAANGNVTPFNGQPHLRVMVNANEPMIVLPSQQSESGPLTPPKPERYRTGNAPKPQSSVAPILPMEAAAPKTDEPEIESEPAKTYPEETAQILAPRLPGVEPAEREMNHSGNLLDDLLSGMSPFMDVQPVEVRRMSTDSRVAPSFPSAPTALATLADAPVGSIIGVDLNTKDVVIPQIIIRWNPGQESWQDAQIDVLRGAAKEGPWTPIVINLSNKGEYWWFLTPEDLKPFYITVRIRSFHGGIREDVTQLPIEIGPRLAQVPRP